MLSTTVMTSNSWIDEVLMKIQQTTDLCDIFMIEKDRNRALVDAPFGFSTETQKITKEDMNKRLLEVRLFKKCVYI